jgi:hypothetical protein
MAFQCGRVRAFPGVESAAIETTPGLSLAGMFDDYDRVASRCSAIPHPPYH